MTRKRSDKGVELIITKHNQPVARLVSALDEAQSKFIGRGSEVIAVTGDIVAPTAPEDIELPAPAKLEVDVVNVLLEDRNSELSADKRRL